MSHHLAARKMPPDAFAVVMAAGIIAVDAQHQSVALVAAAMTAVAVATFAVLLLDAAVRTVRTSSVPIHHLGRPDTALRLFSFVAACAVLGARFHAHPEVLWALGAAAAAAWLILIGLAARDVRTRTFSQLRQHAHGGWLLVGVATANSSITAADVGITRPWAGWLVVSILFWLLGGILYVAVASLIISRVLARSVGPKDVTPDSWILMGTVATLTFAASHVAHALRYRGVFGHVATAADPIIATMWILASAWIPVLIAAEIWHFGSGRGGPRRARTWWSAVFPLGMYSAATQATAAQLHLPGPRLLAAIVFCGALGLFVLIALAWSRTQLHAIRAAA